MKIQKHSENTKQKQQRNIKNHNIEIVKFFSGKIVKL